MYAQHALVVIYRLPCVFVWAQQPNRQSVNKYTLLELSTTNTHNTDVTRTCVTNKMVHYPNPRYIKKAHLRNARPYVWSAADKRVDLEALRATCLRCAQSIARQKRHCDRPAHRRCEHCSEGNRGGCSLVCFLEASFACASADLYRLRNDSTVASIACMSSRTVMMLPRPLLPLLGSTPK